MPREAEAQSSTRGSRDRRAGASFHSVMAPSAKNVSSSLLVAVVRMADGTFSVGAAGTPRQRPLSAAPIARPRGQSQARTGSRDGSESGPRPEPELMATGRPQPETDEESFTARSIHAGTRGRAQPSQDSPGKRSSRPALPSAKLPTSAFPLATEAEAPTPSRSPAPDNQTSINAELRRPPELPIFARVNRSASSPTASLSAQPRAGAPTGGSRFPLMPRAA
jgi:hypothetical protein